MHCGHVSVEAAQFFRRGMADDSSDAPSLETLPDEILRAIFIRLEAEEIGEALRLFTVSRTLRVRESLCNLDGGCKS